MGTEVRATLLGELCKPRLAGGSIIISRAGNQVSSQSSDVYFVIIANYLCYFNLCFRSFGGKASQACFRGIFFSLTRVTWHSMSPGKRPRSGSLSSLPASPPPGTAWSSRPTRHWPTPISAATATATAKPRAQVDFHSDYLDLRSFPWARSSGYSLLERSLGDAGSCDTYPGSYLLFQDNGTLRFHPRRQRQSLPAKNTPWRCPGLRAQAAQEEGVRPGSGETMQA